MSSTVGAIDRAQRSVQHGGAVRQLSASVSLALLVLILGAATTLMMRRLSGALIIPLRGGYIVLAALILECLIVLYRCFFSGTEFLVLSTRYVPRWPRSLPAPAIFSLIIPGLTAFMLLASLTIRGTPLSALFLAWLLLIAAESIQWLLYFRPELTHYSASAVFRPARHSAAEAEQSEIPPGLIQQVTRTLEGDRELIHAVVRVKIAANDRLAVVHLSFCPPLAALPQLSAHSLDADEADVRITQAETFGARLEVRLPLANNTPRTVMIELLGAVTAPKTV